MEVITLNEVCRTCLSKSNNMTLLESIEKSIPLHKKISSICNFPVDVNDTLPQYLCRDCKEKLNNAYDFQQLCQQSHQFIITCINATNTAQKPIKNYNSVIQEISNQPSMIILSENKALDQNIPRYESELIDERGSNYQESDDELTCQPKHNQVTRLSKHSAKDVNAIIKEIKTKFLMARDCIFCNFKANDCRALSVHMTRIHRSEKDTWCSSCNKQVVDIKEHIADFHKNEFKCQLCDKCFQNTSHFIEHLLRHSDDRSHICTICWKSFISTQELKRHSQKHSDTKKPSTLHKNSNLESDCVDENDDKNVLSEETEINKKRSLRYCNKCNKNVRSLSQHNTRCHKKLFCTDKYGALCTLCGKQFRTKSKLSVHMQIHTGEFRHKCSFCDATMSTRSNLVVHERIHTGEKPHICKICGKGFAQTSVLNVHMKLHTGRPEQCILCPKTFCRPSQLKQHMRTHTGEKPYLCSHCGKLFKQRSHLVEHLGTHSSERPYQCEFCEKGFKQISTLKTHINVHLGKKPYQCNQCQYRCRQSYTLKQHVLQHEKNKTKQENAMDASTAWNDLTDEDINQPEIDEFV